MHNSNQITVWLPYLQNHKLLTLCWRWFECIVHSTSAAIDNGFHHDVNFLVVFLTDWDFALWQSWAQQHSSTVRSHTTTINVSCQKVHCTSYTSVYQPVFTSYCSPFAHIISLTMTLCHNTWRTRWNIDAFCPTFIHSLIAPRFSCIDGHQHLSSLPLWLPCRPNQYGKLWRGAHSPLFWAFQILDARIVLYIRFNVRRTIVFTVIWSM